MQSSSDPICIWPPFTSFRYCEHDFVYRKLNGADIDLLVLGVDEHKIGHFIGIATEDLEEFGKIEKKIQEDGAKLETGMIYVPIPTEFVMVQFGGDWHRCKFIEQSGNSGVVYLLDYGTMHTIPMSSIRVSKYI